MNCFNRAAITSVPTGVLEAKPWIVGGPCLDEMSNQKRRRHYGP